MKYEIKRDREIQDERGTTVTFNEPYWIIYFEGRKNVGPFLRGFSKLEKSLKYFIDGIGTNEGIVRIEIETLKQTS